MADFVIDPLTDSLQSQQLQLYPDSHTRPMSEVPTTSSVYSQPSLEFDSYLDHRPTTLPRSSSLYPNDVSPPDTPSMRGSHDRMSTISDMSPISTTPSPTTDRSEALSPSGSRKYNSNLPIPRSNTKKFWKLPNAGSKGSSSPASSTVRWDEYSGEPTAGEKGKPPSATPGSVKLKETPTPLRLKPYGTSTHISGGSAPARKRVGSREISESPILERPEWKGAGGRHSIVKPLFDKPLPTGQPSRFPPGSHKKWLEEQERAQAEKERMRREEAEREEDEREQAEKERLERDEEEDRVAQQAKERALQEQREKERERQQKMARDRIDKAKRERERILNAQEDSARRARERVERVPPPVVPEPLRLTSRTPSANQITNSSSIQPTPTPAEILDAIEAREQATMAPMDAQGTSGSTTPSSQDPRTKVGALLNDDGMSPLARHASHEELKDRRDQSLPSIPSSTQPSPKPPSISEPRVPSKPLTTFPARESSLTGPGESEARFRSNWQQHTPVQEQPKSRFSATTVATTAYENSPPQTPDMSSTVSSPANTPDSILNRKRPVAPAGLVRRKPTPSNVPGGHGGHGVHGGTPNGISRKDSKALPKPPPDAPIIDPVKSLQAKQDVLRRRRRNIETVIHELTNVVQPSPIAYDIASRNEIKKTVSALQTELSEIVKDEHETGLKLHRAWKRHDEFADYEPTSIWVRRVTT